MENESIHYVPTEELAKFMLLHTISSLKFLIEIGKEKLLVMEGITAEIVLEIYYVSDLLRDKEG